MQYFIIVCFLFWAVSLISLCGRRDIDIHSKISWVVMLLVLNALGALLYVIFGPRREVVPHAPATPPFDPERKVWNAVTGYNLFSEEEGLNSKTKRTLDEPLEEAS